MNDSQMMLSAFRQNRGWFFLWGLLLVVLGVLAVGASVFTTMLTIVFIGALLTVSGVIVILDAFRFWRNKSGGFFLHLLMGILYLVVGVMFLTNPESSSVSLTLLLAWIYTLLGLFRIIFSLAFRMLRWGWMFFNGLVTLVLGVLILSQWPMSGLYVIGLFVGIDLFVCGWAYIMAALAAPKA